MRGKMLQRRHGETKRSLLGLAMAATMTTASTQVKAQTTGNMLLEWCESSDEAFLALCAVYIDGNLSGRRSGASLAALKFFNMVVFEVSDEKLQILKDLKVSQLVGLCVPETATSTQITDVITLYLNDFPELRHENANGLVYSALSNAFPCIPE